MLLPTKWDNQYQQWGPRGGLGSDAVFGLGGPIQPHPSRCVTTVVDGWRLAFPPNDTYGGWLVVSEDELTALLHHCRAPLRPDRRTRALLSTDEPVSADISELDGDLEILEVLRQMRNSRPGPSAAPMEHGSSAGRAERSSPGQPFETVGHSRGSVQRKHVEIDRAEAGAERAQPGAWGERRFSVLAWTSIRTVRPSALSSCARLIAALSSATVLTVMPTAPMPSAILA